MPSLHQQMIDKLDQIITDLEDLGATAPEPDEGSITVDSNDAQRLSSVGELLEEAKRKRIKIGII